MDIKEALLGIGEFAAAGLYEAPKRGLFYRKAVAIRRFLENNALPDYTGTPLYPSGEQKSSMVVGMSYMAGINAGAWEIEAGLAAKGHPELAKAICNEFYRYNPHMPDGHTVAGFMYTHSMPDSKRICHEGFNSYIKRIEKIEDTDIKEGLLQLIEGIKCYAERCAKHLESCGAEPRLINALRRVPMKPARDIYEAIVCRNFLLYLDNCDNLGCVASGLMPYYKGENITAELRNLFENLDACGGYSMALSTDYSPLTVQCLKAAKGLRRPMIELFVDDTTPDEIWEAAFELLRSGGGQPAFYSPKLPKLLGERFPEIEKEDLKSFCGGGCTEAMLEGLCNVGSLDAGINLALILEKVIYSHLPHSLSFEEFYAALMEEIGAVVNEVTSAISDNQKLRAALNPVPMRTLLTTGCIEKGIEYNAGGAKYMWSIINFAGMINVIDSLLVIRDFVFRDRLYTPKQMTALLAENDSEFLNMAKHHSSSFGNDNPDADSMAERVSCEIYSMLSKPIPHLGLGFIPASIQFNTPTDAGKGIGATPDGRAAHSPLCDSIGAILGKDTKGPTALIKSVTRLDLSKACGTPVLNFTVNPDFPDDIFKNLILTYMRLGGLQMQINCINKELLIDAYHRPEDFGGLVVRVSGFSEYFCRLSNDLKQSIIERTVQM